MATKDDSMSLQQFISRIKKNGLLASQHYEVELPQIGQISPSTQGINMMCESASLPGVRMQLTDQRIFGEITEIPYMKTYGPVQLTFLVERNTEVLNYFQQWSDMIINSTSRRSGYYDQYKQEVSIYVLDLSSTRKIGYKLLEAFPTEISDMPLSYANHEMMRVTVTLQYKYWNFIRLDGNGKEMSSPPISYSTFDVNSTNFVKEAFRSENVQDLSQVLTNNINPTNMSFDQFGDFAQKAQEYAKVHGVDALRKSNAAYALFEQTLGGQTDTRKMGKGILDLGTITNEMGSDLANIGSSEYSPASSISLGSTLSSMIGTLGDLNSTAQKLGLGNPFANTISSIIAIQTQFNSGTLSPAQMMAAIQSLSQQVKNIGSGYKNMSGLMLMIPGGTAMIQNGINALSNQYTANGNSLNQISNYITP